MNNFNTRSLFLLSTIAAITMSAQAVTVYGLTTRDQLISFDSSTPGTIQQANFISGLSANESLVGFDFRPANNMLYGLGSFGRLYTINPMNGNAVFIASLTNSVTSVPITLFGTEFGVDFNPVANRLRVTSNLGQNLRINVDTGLTVVDGILNQTSGSPFIVASAYTNNLAGATSTSLYNIDSSSDMLTLQLPPNNGTQVNVGSLGVDVSALAGMDIMTVGNTNTAFAALQLAGTVGSRFAQINLVTGAATVVGNIGLEQTSDSVAVRDIAINPVPEPATMTAIAIGLAAIAKRKRNS